MKPLSVWFAAAAAAALVFGTGCSSEEQATIPILADTDPFGWSLPVEVEIENRDTTALCDLSLVVRYDSNADERISLSLTFTAPDSTIFAERAAFPLAHSDKPASQASLDIIPYRRNVRLSQTGVYRVSIMPAGKVQGIEAVGLSLQNSKNR